jgi:CheY-like chemotaxis protein
MLVKILLIDDDEELCRQIRDLLDGETIGDHTIGLKYLTSFEEGLEAISKDEFDLIILDVFKGKPEEKNTDRPGETILEQVKKSCFVPVIFFTGLVKPVEHLKSDIVRIVRKGDGLDSLRGAIKDVFSSKLLFLKQQLNGYVREVMRSYFWDFIHPNWKMLENIKDEVSLGFLVVRRLAMSLSKEKIAGILGDPKISPEKVHPMEFYIFPPVNSEFETGDILQDNNKFFVIVTPSCDFILRKGERKAQKVLLAKCIPLKDTDQYRKYEKSKSKENIQKLKELIESRSGDRYFALPQAPFINNSILDFQHILIIDYEELKKFKKVGRLDDPFAHSMLTYFIRYYNRIGFPDIDSDYVLKNMT